MVFVCAVLKPRIFLVRNLFTKFTKSWRVVMSTEVTSSSSFFGTFSRVYPLKSRNIWTHEKEKFFQQQMGTFSHFSSLKAQKNVRGFMKGLLFSPQIFLFSQHTQYFPQKQVIIDHSFSSCQFFLIYYDNKFQSKDI